MNINLMNFNSIRKLANVKSMSNPVKFTGYYNDRFERYNLERLPERYYEALRENPNTAFLADDAISEEEKAKRIKNSSVLYTSNDLSKQIGHQRMDWFNENCFDYQEYIKKYPSGVYAGHSIKIFDLSKPINRQNLDKLIEVGPNCINAETLRSKCNMSQDEYQRYIKEGHIKRITLTDKNDGSQKNTKLFDVTDPVNIEGMNRCKLLRPKRGDINLQLIRFKKGPIEVDLKKLAELGIGTPKEIASMVAKRELKGTLVRDEQGKIKNAIVDINDEKTQGILQKMRKQRCIGLSELSKKSGVSISKIEDAILSGEMSAIKEIVFIGEGEDILIDVKNQKNIETFDRLLFEKRTQEELLIQQRQDRQETNRENNSLRMKLAWHFCPQTKHVIKRILAQNPELQALMDKKAALESALNYESLNSNEIVAKKEALEELTKQEQIMLKAFFKQMWAQAGQDEFKAARIKAQEIIKQYRANGINSIEDAEIRNIILGQN